MLGGAIGLTACSGAPVIPPGMIGGEDPPAPPPPTSATPPSAGPIPTVLVPDAELHLARRATFGLSADVVADVKAKGAEAWLAEQLAPESIDDGEMDAILGRYPILDASARRINDTGSDDGRQGGTRADEILVRATILRAIYSKRQLFERMVAFWSNHFNVNAPSGDSFGRKVVEDREVIRPLALGTFVDLLKADAKSPAMLRYLNQDASRGDRDRIPNENYAREIMELHCLGAGVLYTEDDIKELARLFTGMTRDDDREYVFRPEWHDDKGPIKVLGFESANTSADNAEAEIDRFLEYLAGLPETARFLSRKLAVHFVEDNPPDGLVDSLAANFLDTGGQIVPWLQTLFGSPEFSGSLGQKVKRPLEDLTSSVRALGLALRDNPEDDNRLRNAAIGLGETPFGMPTPDGYPDTKDKWLSGGELLARWNVHWGLAHGGFAGILGNADEAIDALTDLTAPTTVGAVVDAVAQALIFQDLPAEHRAAVIAFTGREETATVDNAEALRNLCKDVASAVLDSPAHLQR